MNPYNDIQHKLHHFIRKYYTNELIKGSILFVAFGFLYFLFTLFIEYFLWLQPLARTILFWFFILGESLLFGRYILFPILKLIGFAKGLSLEEASTIIGRHFSEVDDKLLNMMQLRSSFPDSELVSASIAQKAANLSPIPFSRAIHLRANAKYLKYLLIPFVIFLLIFSTGRTALFNDSYVRIVNHQQEYSPPAPFYFQIDSLQLQILEGASFTLQVKTVGDVIPNEASIILDGDVFFLQNPSLGLFTYNFDNLRKPVHFYLEANGIRSKSYTIRIIPTPKIQHISMDLHYPKYVGKNNETVNNSGSVIVPVGTHITWKVQTLQADSLFFSTDLKYIPFTPDGSNFILKQYINTNFHYTISASNHFLKDYEKLDFSVQVIDDAYPLIDIKTDIDSLSFGPAQFFGSLSDDYGLSRLELVYYDALHPSDIHTYNIPISKTKISSFYYLFPQHLTIEQGVDYQFYFKVYDNDAVRGPKFTKSNLYNYHKDTDIEHEEKLLLEAKKEEAAIAQQLKKFNQTHKNSKELLDNLRNKKDLEFNDAAELKQLLSRQSNINI
ncbi:MAG TPA: hypothetical protein ENK75_04890 [Saprospiraceae bacterium]|nr:hypothetical protein [Saprospiraceae bacterium]